MASYGNTVLTSAGIDLVKRVIAKTATFEITRVATSSDSRLTNATISAIEAMTALSSVNQTGMVTAFDTSNDKRVGLKCEFTNQGLTNPYKICGVGIYAKEAGKSEILFAVAPAKEPETMPAKPDDQSALFTFSLNMYIVVGQASAMTITATTEGVVKSIKLGDNPTVYPGTDGTVRLPTYTQAEVDAKLSAKADKTSVKATDEGVVKSINGTIKPDANGDVSISYYSQAEVDAKLSAKADTASVKATADSLTTSIANAQGDISTLQHKTDSITSMLSNDGVNLLTGTSSNEVTNTYPTSGFSDTLTYIMPVSADQTDYVLSFDAKSTHAGDRINCYMCNPNQVIESVSSQNARSGYPDGLIGFNLTTDWVRYWVHYKINPTDQTPTIIVGRTGSGGGSGTVSLKCVQLEHGEIATPWQPSGGAISNLQQTVSKLQSDLTNAKGAISSLDSKLPQAAYVPIVSGDKTDLNDIKICGFYLLRGETSNNPVDGWTYVKVLGIPIRLTQFVWQDINPSQQWCRWYDGSNWTPWTHYTQAL